MTINGHMQSNGWVEASIRQSVTTCTGNIAMLNLLIRGDYQAHHVLLSSANEIIKNSHQVRNPRVVWSLDNDNVTSYVSLHVGW